MHVVRLRHSGQDRLCVRLDDDTTVGWIDLATGRETLLRDDLRREFEELLGGPMRQASRSQAW